MSSINSAFDFIHVIRANPWLIHRLSFAPSWFNFFADVLPAYNASG
jgi:hypothetical protein